MANHRALVLVLALALTTIAATQHTGEKSSTGPGAKLTTIASQVAGAVQCRCLYEAE